MELQENRISEMTEIKLKLTISKPPFHISFFFFCAVSQKATEHDKLLREVYSLSTGLITQQIYYWTEGAADKKKTF